MLPDRFLVIENSTKSWNLVFPGVEVKKEVNNWYNSSTKVRTYSRVRREYWVAQAEKINKFWVGEMKNELIIFCEILWDT